MFDFGEWNGAISTLFKNKNVNINFGIFNQKYTIVYIILFINYINVFILSGIIWENVSVLSV